MLQSIHIQNYALIESLDIDFHPGFSVITGETGAGKSIILGAIGLLVGQRADIKAIKNGEYSISEEVLNRKFYDKKKRSYTVKERLMEERRALKRKDSATSRFEIR